MKVWLIRHGRTEANVRMLYCGWTDIGLTEAGRADLQALKMRMAYPDTRNLRVITSGLKRADETLEILFGTSARDVMIGFREMNFGRFEMRSYDELKSLPEYQLWIMDESGDTAAPEGESKNAFQARVFTAFDSIREDSLVVCHGGVISAIMQRLFPNEGRNMYQWQPGGGLGYMLEYRDGAWTWSQLSEKNTMAVNAKQF